METLASAPACRHTRLRVETRHPTEFVDLTERIEAGARASGIRDGLVSVHTLHTTTAIVVNEHEPLLLADFTALLARLAPEDAPYRHDDMTSRTVNLAPGERANGHAHCRALLLPSSAVINLVEGRLQIGRWQRIFLVELDGPRLREISLQVIGEAAR
jgi:secondary thiamine-phosphate synthase enzyme